MNIFLKALLKGELTPTPKLEKKMNAMPGINKRYREVEKSDVMNEYRQLHALMQSEAYQINKKNTARLATLEKNSKIKQYKALLNNSQLQQFIAFAADAIQYAQLSDAEAVKNNATLKLMKKMDGSKEMRLWRQLQHDTEIAEYLELKKTVVDYSKQEERYKYLVNDPDVKFFLNQDEKKHQRFESFETIFEDNFDLTDISAKGWKPGFAYPEGFKAVHSYSNEQQAYVGGKNVEIKDSILYLHTKKEEATGASWDAKKGMITEQFHYTSDSIFNTAEFEEGCILQVKARCRGFLNHGIYLRSKKHIPFISLFNYAEQKAYCGLKASLQENDYKHELKGLQPIPFAIFTMIWGKDEIIWYLNDLEVHRTKNIIPKGEKLFLHMFSFQFKGKRISEGQLEVDWVRAYKLKN
ncbi:MAG: hypothetical protein MJZ92_03490 [Paludibacteraceae bacterium]|nr:hypothetical protein [Paludibacteraceae bacterium]